MIKFKDAVPVFTRPANYGVDVPWDYVEGVLESWNREGELDLDPDFQRAHVWSVDKQIKFVEYKLRGGMGSKDIMFNCSTWQKTWDTPVFLVDGKQRLEAVRAFVRGDIKAFGYRKDEFEGFPKNDSVLRFNVNNLQTRKEVLQWYLDLNEGGVVHTSEEIEKVRKLLLAE